MFVCCQSKLNLKCYYYFGYSRNSLIDYKKFVKQQNLASSSHGKVNDCPNSSQCLIFMANFKNPFQLLLNNYCSYSDNTTSSPISHKAMKIMHRHFETHTLVVESHIKQCRRNSSVGVERRKFMVESI